MLVHNQLQYGSRFIKQCELFMHLSSAIPWGGDPGQGWGLCKGPCQSSYFPPPRWGHRGIKVPLPEGNHLEQLET